MLQDPSVPRVLSSQSPMFSESYVVCSQNYLCPIYVCSYFLDSIEAYIFGFFQFSGPKILGNFFFTRPLSVLLNCETIHTLHISPSMSLSTHYNP